MTEESPIFTVPDGGSFIDPAGVTRPTNKYVSFRFEAMESPAASRAQGRKVFDRVLMMRNHYPGSRDTLDRELLRFREGSDAPTVVDEDLWPEYRAVAESWMDKQGAAANGTPLALLNFDVAQIAELRAAGLGSVEMLAEVPDSALRNFPGARGMRDRATAYLDAQKGAAPLAKVQAENDAMRAELEALRQELRAAVAARQVEDDDDAEPAPKRRGRPPRQEAA
jgi:hypothetical protein